MAPLDLFTRAVLFRRVTLRLFGAALLFTVLLRVVLLLFGAAFLRVVFLRVVLLLFGAALRLVVLFRRVVFLRFGAAFLRVVLRRRVVVFLRFGAARRRVVVLRRAADFLRADTFLLAILFTLFLVVFLRLVEPFLFAGLRGFRSTTSFKGIRTDPSDYGGAYKEQCRQILPCHTPAH